MIIKNNVLQLPFDRGLQIILPLQSIEIDFTTYTTIVCDVKTVKSLDATPVLSFSLGNGIEATQTSLTLTITEAQSKTLDLHVYWMDIKARIGSGAYTILMEGKLINEETVTEQPT